MRLRPDKPTREEREKALREMLGTEHGQELVLRLFQECFPPGAKLPVGDMVPTILDREYPAGDPKPAMPPDPPALVAILRMLAAERDAVAIMVRTIEVAPVPDAGKLAFFHRMEAALQLETEKIEAMGRE